MVRAGVLGLVAVVAVGRRFGRPGVARRPAGQLHAGRGAGLPRTAPVRRVQGGQEDVQGVQFPEVAPVPGAAPETFPGHALVQEDHVAGRIPVDVAGHGPVRVRAGPRHTAAARQQVQPVRGVQPLGYAHSRTLHGVLPAPGHRRLELLQRQFRVQDHVADQTRQQRGVHTVLRSRRSLTTASVITRRCPPLDDCVIVFKFVSVRVYII